MNLTTKEPTTINLTKTKESLDKPVIYLAHCLGFYADKISIGAILNPIKFKLIAGGFEVYDPFEHPQSDPKQIFENNLEALKKCFAVIALLDYAGADVDSGIAAEIGYASGLGKLICGITSSTRISDVGGSAYNVQVMGFLTLTYSLSEFLENPLFFQNDEVKYIENFFHHVEGKFGT